MINERYAIGLSEDVECVVDQLIAMHMRAITL